MGGGTPLTNLELAGRLLRALDASPDLLVHVGDRKGHDRRYSVDVAKISAELGYRPRRDLDTGLDETVRWFRERLSTQKAAP